MQAHGELTYCPRCDKEVRPASQPCRHCGYPAVKEEGYEPYEVVGKCECGGDITRGERDAAGICTTCYFERMPA